jgi:hypothetical protein
VEGVGGDGVSRVWCTRKSELLQGKIGNVVPMLLHPVSVASGLNSARVEFNSKKKTYIGISNQPVVFGLGLSVSPSTQQKKK